MDLLSLLFTFYISYPQFPLITTRTEALSAEIPSLVEFAERER